MEEVLPDMVDMYSIEQCSQCDQHKGYQSQLPEILKYNTTTIMELIWFKASYFSIDTRVWWTQSTCDMTHFSNVWHEELIIFPPQPKVKWGWMVLRKTQFLKLSIVLEYSKPYRPKGQRLLVLLVQYSHFLYIAHFVHLYI